MGGNCPSCVCSNVRSRLLLPGGCGFLIRVAFCKCWGAWCPFVCASLWYESMESAICFFEGGTGGEGAPARRQRKRQKQQRSSTEPHSWHRMVASAKSSVQQHGFASTAQHRLQIPAFSYEESMLFITLLASKTNSRLGWVHRRTGGQA